MSHLKIMKKAAKELAKDVKHYKKEEKKDRAKKDTKELKHHKIEEKEASSAAKELRKRARKAHE